MCATCTAHLIVLYFDDGKNMDKNNCNFGSNSSEVAKESVEFCFNHLVPSGYYTYHQVKRSEMPCISASPSQYVCLFCTDIISNSDYFPIQH